MRKLGILLKINFQAMLRSFSVGKKRSAGWIGALALMAFLALYLSGVYSFMLADLLSSIGNLQLLIPMMTILATIVSVIFTIFAASGLVFGSKDSNLLLPLPVSAFTVMLSKVLALYLENLVFSGLWMIPATVAYLFYGGGSAFLIFPIIISIIFVPLLSSLFALLGGWLIAFLSAHSRHRALMGNLISGILLAVVLIGSMRVNHILQALLLNANQVEKTLHTGLFLFGWLMDGLQGNFLSLLWLVLFCFLPFLLISWALSSHYQKLLSKMQSHVLRNDYHLQKLQSNSQFAALFKKECGRYFGTTIYLFNTGIGVLIMIGFSIYALVAGQSLFDFVQQIGEKILVPILALGICAIISMTNTTCVSISLEGNTFWVLKGSPVPTKIIFSAKAALNLIICWVGTIVSVPLLGIAFSLPVLSTISLLLVGLAMGIFVAQFGLMANLKFPKMNGENDTIIVKQSASAFCGIFGGMLLTALLAGAFYLLSSHLEIEQFLFLASAFLFLLALAIHRWLLTRGAEIFKTL